MIKHGFEKNCKNDYVKNDAFPSLTIFFEQSEKASNIAATLLIP